jgi:hypothetical protein
VVSYWKVIMSIRLSVVAFDFKGSLAKFALPEFNTWPAQKPSATPIRSLRRCCNVQELPAFKSR